MKLLNFTKIWILMALVLNCAHADIDRTYFKSDEEINKEYQNDPQGLEQYGADAQRQYLKKYEQSILDAADLPQDQAIELLATKLMAASMRSTFQVTGRIQVYDKIQAALLAVPGYSDYYTDQIEQSRAKIKDPTVQYGDSDVSNYDGKRGSAFAVMGNLPGPETIKFLGHYLDDLRDPREEPSPCAKKLQRTDFSEEELAISRAIYLEAQKREPAFLRGTNASSASSALHRIGLRNSPTEQSNEIGWNIPENIALNKAWWQQVKTGQIPFSFVRQTVEYRFRPDGTWETTQLPVSVLERDKNPAAPAQPPSTVRPEKRNLPDPAAATQTIAAQQVSPASRYVLPALGLLALLLGAWYFLRNRKVL